MVDAHYAENDIMQISDEQLQTWIRDGVTQAAESMIRGAARYDQQIISALNTAIRESSDQIQKQVALAIVESTKSPEFQRAVADQVIDALKGSFHTVFTGVARKAAKDAAKGEAGDKLRKMVANVSPGTKVGPGTEDSNG